MIRVFIKILDKSVREKRFTAKFAKEEQRTQGQLGSPEILAHSKQIILPYITNGYLMCGERSKLTVGMGIEMPLLIN